MEQRTDYLGLLALLFLLYAAAKFPSPCEGRHIRHLKKYIKFNKHPREQKSKPARNLQVYTSLDSFYVGSPFSLPPFENVMGPYPSPQDYPPFCVYPPPFPNTPMPPLGTIPIQSPPPPPPMLLIPNPPEYIPSPPEAGPGTPTIGPGTPIVFPGPPGYEPTPPGFQPNPPGFQPNPPGFEPAPPGAVPSPPEAGPGTPTIGPGAPIVVPGPPGYEPTPPGIVPSPPEYIPGPPEFVPGPPIFLPPIVYPPPNVPPPPLSVTTEGLWCVAKPTVPDPIIQEAMSYACGSGADCDEIQPNGSCYLPDTTIAHASFAFNSYWQRTRIAGGTCDFGGTAILVTRDPSYDGCHFMMN
ncbi:hypothetical protein HPP92_013740 [Vanilla planifolia]|uniref:X8 domain-containing protein n=1 Tax=Vanilla planifolia TaxID=51239 RepID=A0A835V0W8_VANPL|nr:hypothetical protein HPP92_026461 [Vanilla planifolia]KAG0479021.1 hypothetical protein HPP92_013740 [Vanilla planifolia]